MWISIKRESNLRWFWFCFTPLCDWFKNPTPLSQQMRNKTKTNRIFAAHFFPLLALV